MTKKCDIRDYPVFGSLTPIREGAPSGIRGRITYVCRCVCGNEKTYIASRLRSGAVTSCGCKTIASRLTHGYTGTPTYSTWQSMLKRCLKSTDKNYSKYSKLGVCPEWTSFESFLAAVGERPSMRHTLDRINNSVGYFPGNVRWSSWEEQQRNRTNNRLILVTGSDGECEAITLAEVAERLGLTRTTVQQRLSKHKKPIKEALGPAYSWPDQVNPYTGEIDD